MVVGKLTYEECRRKRLEENKKRLEALRLIQLSQALQNSSRSPTPSPMKQVKPCSVQKQVVAVRRSKRLAHSPAPVYIEVAVDLVEIPRRIFKWRDLLNRVYASDEARVDAIERAEKLQSVLESDYPCFVRSMLPSHVTGGFWLGLSTQFCKANLPRSDDVITLVDEKGDEYPTIYLT